MTNDIIDELTAALLLDDVKENPEWIDKAVLQTTSNLDRAIINIEAAKLYGQRKRKEVIRWRQKLKKVTPNTVE
jgi:hypothetical protein